MRLLLGKSFVNNPSENVIMSFHGVFYKEDLENIFFYIPQFCWKNVDDEKSTKSSLRCDAEKKIGFRT